ncbi:hypothetical protein [Pedobacter endophyticus]|nr:hypothetical protein [Pedobacter endophyticus]
MKTNYLPQSAFADAPLNTAKIKKSYAPFFNHPAVFCLIAGGRK